MGDCPEFVAHIGDGWQHEINIEKILPVESGIKYPKCIAGERACPPEDCGSYPGYDELVELIRLPKDNLDEDDLYRLEWLAEWYGEDYDFDYFSVDHVNSFLWKMRAR